MTTCRTTVNSASTVTTRCSSQQAEEKENGAIFFLLAGASPAGAAGLRTSLADSGCNLTGSVLSIPPEHRVHQGTSSEERQEKGGHDQSAGLEPASGLTRSLPAWPPALSTQNDAAPSVPPQARLRRQGLSASPLSPKPIPPHTRVEAYACFVPRLAPRPRYSATSLRLRRTRRQSATDWREGRFPSRAALDASESSWCA